MPSWSRKSSCQSSDLSNKSSERSCAKSPAYNMNRALSIRSRKSTSESGHSSTGSRVHGFSLSSLRGQIQPELSRKIYKVIKTTNNLVSAHEAAGRERAAIAGQLSDWGEQTGDEAISDVSDKVGVIFSELGEQEDAYAHAVDESRSSLKTIRNTEKSVQPSRDGKRKIADEIAKLKSKEPESTRLVTLEQELVRAEAENLVAEAQLTNITRQKLKEAYDAEFLATIERAEKQIILARHGRRLIQLLDDNPVVPGQGQRRYVHGAQARQILNDAEDDLREWEPEPDDHYMEANDQHEIIPDDKALELQSPTSISHASSGEAVEDTPTAGPQGEHQSVRGGKFRGDEGDSVNGGGGVVVEGLRWGPDAEHGPQSPQPQLDGSTTIFSESPVSSEDGWRQHGNMLRSKQAGLTL